MSLDELRDAKLEIDKQIEKLRAKKRGIAAIETAKLEKEKAERRAATLSDDEKRVLVQELKLQGFDASNN